MKIPFGKTFKVTPAQLKDGIAEGVVDGYTDYDGTFKSRLGPAEWVDMAGVSVDGLYVNKDGITVAVSSGVVTVIAIDGTESVCTGPLLTVGTLCTFAEDPNYVFIAHGGQIAQVNVTAKTVTLLSTASAPVGATHVAYIQGYLVANGTGGVVGDTFFTGPYTIADYLTVWEVYNNESLPDGCSAVMEDGQFIYNFGTRSVEIAVNDGVTPWAKYSTGYIPYGIHAPYSVAKADNTFFWLGFADNALRVLKMVGGNAKTISTPYDTVINAMTTTVDAYGYVTGIEGHTFYILQFPSEDMTLAYHLQNDAWYRWGYYNTLTSQYESFLGRCHAYNPATGKNLIGSRKNGKIGTLDALTDFGATIRFELTSGNISGNTYKQKRGGRMRFQLQRGLTTDPTAEPYIRWQHRDDGGGWCPERQVSLGQRGQYNYLGQLDRTGIYRERQHRIVFTESTCQLVLVDVQEESRLLED